MNDLVEHIDRDESEVRKIRGRIISLSSRNSNYSDSSRRTIDSNSLVIPFDDN